MTKKILKVVAVSFLGTLSLFAGKSVIVDLSTQTATAYENDVPVFSGQISSGTAKRPTPTGRFRVLEKDIDHVSSSWPKPNGGAKMHYMLRLTNYGIAMHLGFVPDYPASHGCIRLQNGFAQRMYKWAYVGMPVRVIGHAPARVHRPTSKRVARSHTTQRRKSRPLEVISSNTNSYKKRIPNRTTKKQARRKRAKREAKKSVARYQKPTTLDILSTSPKAAKRVKAAQEARWRRKPKKHSPRVDPLEVLKA